MSEISFLFPKQSVVQRHSLFQGNLLFNIRHHYQTFPRHIPPPLLHVHQITTNLITDFMALLRQSYAPSRGHPFPTGDGLVLHLNTTGNAFSNTDSDLMAPNPSWAHHSLLSYLC